MNSFTLEVCVDSMESALAAQEGGAHRIELCSSLLEGGLTPSPATIEFACKLLSLDVNVMIRPRGGDFLFSELEHEIMCRDVEVAKSLGADGVVIGELTADGEIDIEGTKELVALARPLTVTFHRAFDLVANCHTSLETLIEIGVDRVLTSGQATSVSEGADTIISLIRQAAGRIIVMPGAGVSENNIVKLQNMTGAVEFHMSGRVLQQSEMRHRNAQVALGASPTQEYERQVTSAARIRSAFDALSRA